MTNEIKELMSKYHAPFTWTDDGRITDADGHYVVSSHLPEAAQLIRHSLNELYKGSGLPDGPFRVGKRSGRTVLDMRGIVLCKFEEGQELLARMFCDFLNSPPFTPTERPEAPTVEQQPEPESDSKSEYIAQLNEIHAPTPQPEATKQEPDPSSLAKTLSERKLKDVEAEGRDAEGFFKLYCQVRNDLCNADPESTYYLETAIKETYHRYFALSGPTPSAAEVTGDGWVSVSERLPEVGEYVLIVCYTDVVMKGILKHDGWEAIWKDGINTAEVVTHWMPLPSPPKK